MKVEDLATQVVDAARGFVQRSLVGVNAKLAELEQRIASVPAGPRGEKGEPGEAIRGEKGDPGKDADPELVRAEVARAIASIPAPENGKDGPQGPPGRDGKDFDPSDIELAVARAVAALPRASDGAPGRDGRDGLPGVPGKDGSPGADGRDGFGLEDFQMELGDDGRTISLKFVRGDVVVERKVKLQTMLYRGVWREGENEPGDVVTWAGSAWHCQQPTNEQPGTGSPAWRLMVKKGAPGKDGVAPAGPVANAPVRLK